jgi:hypothetical protein
MSVERVELLVRDQTTGHELKREWSKPELVKSIAWLKRMNARGSEVFIRPAGPHGLVLLDRLKADDLEAMRHKGFEPAVVVESNPGVFQAWVALSGRPITDEVRQFAAEGLARGFGATLPAATANGFGRLAGLTFNDWKSDPVMRKRFVLAHEGHSTIASNGEKLVTHVENTLRALQVERDRQPAITAQPKGKDRGRSR